MVRGGVDVPAGHVDGLVGAIVLEGEGGQGGVHPGLVGEGHGGTVTPVEESPVGRCVIVELGDVGQGETLGQE